MILRRFPCGTPKLPVVGVIRSVPNRLDREVVSVAYGNTHELTLPSNDLPLRRTGKASGLVFVSATLARHHSA